MSHQPASRALADIMVLDLTRVRSGPTCVRQLADWGADVIKIELPESGDGDQPVDFDTRGGPDFQNMHRNKRSMTLNLKSPDGVAILKRMVEKADVLVENYRPDVKHRLGIAYDDLKSVNPRLIYASISGFGQDGPYKDRPGVDQIAQGMSGLMSITGEPGRGPMRAGIALGDLAAGLLAANGVLVALHERETSGEGQWVQTSLLQALLFLLDFQGARYTIKGEVPGQAGNNHPTGVPTGTYQTKDGYVNLAPPPFLWLRFCRAVGHEEWTKNPDFATAALRRQHRQELNKLIAAITRETTTDALIEQMNAAGIPCGPIYTIEQAFNDPQVKHLGVTQTVHSPELGDINVLAQGVTLSRTPSLLKTATPACGEHTDEILTRFGYSGEDIHRFHDTGVV
jgi:crotonobetainyl-CoA:carnitine CoA-transferase CaiB-like acyl-CoA transferase